MTKREKVLSGIIGLLLIVVAIVGYKAYDYRKNLLEKKKIIVQKDELFKKSIRYGYEALIRTEYVDAIRTYMIRHPFNTNSLAVDLQTSIRKSEESATNFGNFAGENRIDMTDITEMINKEKSDFKDVVEKHTSYVELMTKEDEKNNKEKN